MSVEMLLIDEHLDVLLLLGPPRSRRRIFNISTSSPAVSSSAPAKDEAKKTYDYGRKGGKVCQVNGAIVDVRLEDQEGLPPITCKD
ncbi:hypothetical protein Bca101_020406 [Brassica carinata]